ncbi:MAG TPA: ester cyclase [Thermoanaerobaculia bacterium]|jgi:steroid delta-isomerase-like uncharacterized protein|nr:ester cyclase [Thermoanaerobaculia bacterium]
MDGTAHKTIVRGIFDQVLNNGRLGMIDDCVADDFVEHNPVPGQGAGREGVKHRVRALRDAFPDLRFVLDEVVAENEIVAVRYRWEGTHTGAFLGIPATGRRVAVRGMDFYRFKNGRIAEHWDNMDELSMLTQLGDLG